MIFFIEMNQKYHPHYLNKISRKERKDQLFKIFCSSGCGREALQEDRGTVQDHAGGHLQGQKTSSSQVHCNISTLLLVCQTHLKMYH